MALSDRTNIFDKHEDEKKRIKELEDAIRKHRKIREYDDFMEADVELWALVEKAQ